MAQQILMHADLLTKLKDGTTWLSAQKEAQILPVTGYHGQLNMPEST